MHSPITKIVLHLTLWGISFLLLYKLFTIDYDSGFADVLYTALFHIPLLLTVYANLLLIKLFFEKRQYGFYVLFVFLLIATGVGMYFLIFRLLVPLLLAKYYFIAYYSPWQIVQFMAVYLFLSLLFHLAVGWFFLRENEFQLQKENHQVQLRNLKAQINPHFLFNSLNNIYALVGPDNLLARDYLTKLSDSLRYMIYETNAEFVPLKDEVQYLENYFELEKLRLSGSEAVSIEKQGHFDQYVIAPLLLLPLVENCFRHCNRKDPHIRIGLEIKDEVLSFQTRNNVSSIPTKASGGVGLVNVQRRLELIYKERAKLTFRSELNFFELDLKLNLSEE